LISPCRHYFRHFQLSAIAAYFFAAASRRLIRFADFFHYAFSDYFLRRDAADIFSLMAFRRHYFHFHIFDLLSSFMLIRHAFSLTLAAASARFQAPQRFAMMRVRAARKMARFDY
jgi:hypothetical protein